MKKKVVSLALASVMVLGSVSMAAAAPYDLVHKTNDPAKNYSFLQFMNSNTVFNKVSGDLGNYLLTAKDGKLYSAVEVDAKISKNPGMQFDEAVVGLTPVEIDKPVEGELKVVEVSAINANEIQVTFNAPVDATSALDLNNYVITINDVKYGADTTLYTDINTLVSAANKVINKDKTVVTFKLTNATKLLAHGDKYGVDVKDGVLSADGDTQLERYGDTQKIFSDLAAPKLVDTKLVGSTLRLTFDEPVDMQGDFGVTVNGINVGALTAPTVPLNYTYTVSLAAFPALLANGTHDVTIFNARDYVVNNANTGNRAAILTSNYTVDNKAEQPKVLSVDPIDFNSFEIEFDKDVVEGRVIVKKGNAVFFDEVVTIGSDLAVIELPITVTAVAPLTGLTWMYDTNATSTNLTVEVKDYKDTDASLYGDNYAGAVTLNRDDVKPRGISGELVAAEAGLEVQLNRATELATGTAVAVKTPGNLNKNKITVTDKDGIVRTINTATVDATGKIEITLDGFGPADTTYSSLAPFKVEFSSDVVRYETDDIKAVSPKDLAGNSFAIGDFTAELKNDAFAITIAPKESGYKAIEAVQLVAEDETINEIVVTYKEKMGASAVKVANYTLDGKALPTGTTATLSGDSKIVTIVLGDNSFTTNQERRLGISTDVLTAKGEHVVGNLSSKEAYLSGALKISDNIKPELVSAKFTNVATDDTTDTFELTFSENVTLAADNTTNFVVIAHDGTELEAKASAVAAQKKMTLTLENGKKVNVNQAIKVKVAEETATNTIAVVDQTDLTAKNKLVDGTVVTVVK